MPKVKEIVLIYIEKGLEYERKLMFYLWIGIDEART